MSNVTFTEHAWEDYLFWQTQGKQELRRINALLKDIQRNPFDGIGKPEPLKGPLSGCWSRRINAEDRLVYSVAEGTIIVRQCKGHYSG